MITRRSAGSLMLMYGGFEWIRLVCNQVVNQNKKYPVNGFGFFLNVFERSEHVTKSLSKSFDSLKDLHHFTLQWIKYLKKEYKK